MALAEVWTDNFTCAREQDEQVRVWQERYFGLLGHLSSLGTEVSCMRILEIDQDSPPYLFIRSAKHRFVFPPQPDAQVVRDSADMLDPTEGYSLQSEVLEKIFNVSIIRGEVEVLYDDSNGGAHLSVTDMRRDSELPDEVHAVLAEATAAGDSADSRPQM